MSSVKYPEVDVKLVGQDGNAFNVIGRVVKEMRRAGIPKSEISKFESEAMSGDYDNLLTTTMRWVNVY